MLRLADTQNYFRQFAIVEATIDKTSVVLAFGNVLIGAMVAWMTKPTRSVTFKTNWQMSFCGLMSAVGPKPTSSSLCKMSADKGKADVSLAATGGLC